MAAGTGSRLVSSAPDPGMAALPAAAVPAPARASAPGSGSAAGDAPARWLAVAMAALAVLSAAAAVVSFAAQYQMVRGAKGGAAVSALEAGIPDVAAVIFATLGIALALHGRRAIRARLLNLAAVGTSVGMNVLAAGPGWRNLAIWVMPPVAYALASDTAIGVVRARTLARQRHLDAALADGASPLALLGGLVLWLLRLVLAPASTLSGFRAWVIEECPVAPGRVAPGATARPAALLHDHGPTSRPATPGAAAASGAARPGTKTARFLDLVTRRYGPLAGLALADVSRVSSELAPAADLHPGAARAALRRHVQAARASQAARAPAAARPAENRNPR
jgi:hypothetical protein